ncbi:MAG: hypothetical protein OXD47_09900 [Gammaproteobacteria bacterium]|nr:hypothetical protein [Gammaproteobacteria bacterium]MCY4211298.1 hypothetical protein [Gammaproteobacteria bacterium]MCY4283187.1 hypothetical protein [Gammaproteobacteria bacterium]MCY4339095.1 hypothetical protein [Gammaproteobacteria bacterium]
MNEPIQPDFTMRGYSWIDAGAAEEKAAEASAGQDRVFRMEKDIVEIKGRLNLLISIVVPLLVIIIVKLFGIV